MKTIVHRATFGLTLLLAANLIAAAQKPELVVQLGNSDVVRCVAFSPDGKVIVTGDGFSPTLILWDVKTGLELRQFIGHTSDISGVAFSHDGRYIASISNDDTIRKWDVATGQELLKIDDKEVGTKRNLITFTSDDRMLAVGGDYQEGGLQLWDSNTGKLLWNASINLIAFSSSGNLALILNNEQQKERDLPEGYSILDLFTRQAISSLNFDDGPRKFVVGIESANFSPDDKSLTLIRSIGAIKLVGIEAEVWDIWDVGTGKLIEDKKIPDSFNGHRESLITSNTLIYSCNDGNLAPRERDSLCFFNSSAEETTEIPVLGNFLHYSNSIRYLASSQDGQFIAGATWGGTIAIFNLSEKKQISWLAGQTASVFGVSISSDGRSVSTVGEDSSKVNWNLDTGKPVVEEAGSGGGKPEPYEDVDKISPNGRWRIKSDPTSIFLLDVSMGKELFKFSGHKGRERSASFSADSSLVATGDQSGEVRIWSTETGELKKILNGHQAAVLGIAFMPDGRTLVTGSRDCTTRLWDIESGIEKAKLIFSIDGNWAVIDPAGRFDASPNAEKLLQGGRMTGPQ